jgi:hypothetical protein
VLAAGYEMKRLEVRMLAHSRAHTWIAAAISLGRERGVENRCAMEFTARLDRLS